jgi:Domain of unknown function (DUF5069)
MSENNLSATDLTQRPPRSARARLGGYVLLPRMLDKGRAAIGGKNGEYHYNCPLDQRILSFLGIDAAALQEQLATGKGDGEILQWIEANQTNKRSEFEIAAWSAYQAERSPADPDSREFFNSMHKSIAPQREDIVTWADILDLDDYVSFGGKA